MALLTATLLFTGGAGCGPGNEDCCPSPPCSCGTGGTTGADLCAGVTCTPPDKCHEAGTCDPKTGTCTDGAAVTCTPPDKCHEAATCDPSTGTCEYPAKADGTECDDDDKCTQTDTCLAGSCTGSNPIVCTPLDQCHESGTCDPATAICDDPAKADGSACDDSDKCTQTDTCLAGACTGSNQVVCTPLDQCHEAGTCDPATGVCDHPAKADGTACDDGDACTLLESCQGGNCALPPESSCSGGPCQPCNVLAEYQVWHGLESHSPAYQGVSWMNPLRAYDSQDKAILAKHIAAAKARGICGFVVDWYGPSGGYSNDVDRAFQDLATKNLFEVAEQSGFWVALLYDEGAVSGSGANPADYQTIVQTDLAWAQQQYFTSPAYLPMNGKPALFVFPYESQDPVFNVDPNIDWPAVRASLGTPVTLLDKDPDPTKPAHDAAFDGFFAWVQTNPSDPLDWGQGYLDWFYSTMLLPEYCGKITVGGVWPGFDDCLAPWGQNRFMSRAGHGTYDSTWVRAQQAVVPAILIETWNDSEEGTDTEFGVDMVLDMELTYPEIVIRSTPLQITWAQGGGSGVLQVYKGGTLFKDLGERFSGQYFSFQPKTAYEIKVWVNGAPLARTVKIRSNDPIPGISPIDVEQYPPP